MSNIYLDYAAATPMDAECRAAMEPFFTNEFYNPSASYLAGRHAKKLLNGFRHDVAMAMGARSPEIIFTAGATEANNLAIHGIMRRFGGNQILTSTIEHDSVMVPAQQYNHGLIKVDKNGVINLESLKKSVTDSTVLISVGMVNNEIGTVQPIKKVTSFLRNVRDVRRQNNNNLPIFLHTDAAQAAGYFDLTPSRLGVDLLSINGGKIYGPKQSGALYVRSKLELKPYIYGGGQERSLRSGTENIAFAAGLSNALVKSQKIRTSETKRLTELKNYFAKELQKIDAKVNLNGSSKHVAPHILSVTFGGADNEKLMMQLDEAGIICAVGSACSASSTEPSHVLSAIGLSEDMVRSTLRFSFGRDTTKEQLIKTTRVIKTLL